VRPLLTWHAAGSRRGRERRRGHVGVAVVSAAETNDLSKSLANGLIWAWLQVYEICLFPEFSWLKISLASSHTRF
jgi:hypothetical protein